MYWKSKVVIVTGASSGIGAAIVKNLLNSEAKVVMAARNCEKMEAIAAAYSKENYLIIKTDVSVEVDCKNLIEKTVEKFGRIDVLINDAGLSMRALLQDLDLQVLHRLMDVNFWGTVYCTKFALPYLLESKGSVCAVSSIAGYQGLPARTGYSSSKFAIHGFLNTLRIETMKKGLHVMIACPGFTSSNIRNTALTADGSPQGHTPLNESKLMTAEYVAARILHCLKKRKRKVIMTFEGKLSVLLGKFFPRWVDRQVYNELAKEENSPFK